MWVPRQEVGQVLFGDYACMHAVLCCAIVLCCAVLCYLFSSFTLFLPCECVCVSTTFMLPLKVGI